MTKAMTKREKAWSWVEGLLQRVGTEGVSPNLLEAVLKEVGYHDPYEVINDWSKEEGPLRIVVGHRGDTDYHARRYAWRRSDAG
jgi:hypothetical protein